MSLDNPTLDVLGHTSHGPHGPSDNPFLDPGVPTITTILQRIDGDKALPAARRAQLASALRTMARLLGQNPEAMPAVPGLYRFRVSRLSPAGTGLSAKRLANIRSDVLFALRHYGGLRVRSALPQISDAWQPVWDRLGKYQRCQLSRFIRWCSAAGIDPHSVSDDTVRRFLADLETESFVKKPRELAQSCCHAWNSVAEMRRSLGLQQLTVPRFRQCYLVRAETLPETFQAELRAFCARLAGTDPLAESGPPRPLRPATVFRRRFQILQLASGLIASGRRADTIRTLSDLAAPEALRAALQFFLARSGGRKTTQLSELANVALMIARHWAPADAATVTAIKRLQAKVAFRNRSMTVKNAARLRQFEDPENLRRLLLLPDEVFAELRHRDCGYSECAEARSALAVAILLAAPLRLGNLVTLRLNVHLLNSRSARGAWHLVIPAEETKNTRALEFILPSYVTALLRQYLERYRPRIAPADSDFLFASPSRGPLALNTFGPQMSRFVRKRTGLEINPHLFRHLAAKLVLEDTPGAYGIAQDILGHKDPMTTRNFYAGTETAASLRHFERVVQRKREATPQKQQAKRRVERP